jgi:hypothetical protein
MRERILITFCLLLMISSNSIAADSASECFDRLANKTLPFEIYRGDMNTVFFKPVGSSDKGISFTPDGDAIGYNEIGVAPLCDGNYVTIRKYSNYKFPIRLTGRIIGKDYTPMGNDFLISDSESSDDRQHSVDTIYPKGFVVVGLLQTSQRERVLRLRLGCSISWGNRSIVLSMSPHLQDVLAMLSFEGFLMEDLLSFGTDLRMADILEYLMAMEGQKRRK